MVEKLQKNYNSIVSELDTSYARLKTDNMGVFETNLAKVKEQCTKAAEKLPEGPTATFESTEQNLKTEQAEILAQAEKEYTDLKTELDDSFQKTMKLINSKLPNKKA